MLPPPTFGDLIKFILENKKDKVFIGNTVEQIEFMCRRGIEQGTLLFSVGTDNAIDGMILAEDRPDEKVLFIGENLAMNIRNLIKFAKIAKDRRPGWRLEWIKHGIYKKPNTDKFYHNIHI